MRVFIITLVLIFCTQNLNSKDWIRYEITNKHGVKYIYERDYSADMRNVSAVSYSFYGIDTIFRLKYNEELNENNEPVYAEFYTLKGDTTFIDIKHHYYYDSQNRDTLLLSESFDIDGNRISEGKHSKKYDSYDNLLLDKDVQHNLINDKYSEITTENYYTNNRLDSIIHFRTNDNELEYSTKLLQFYEDNLLVHKSDFKENKKVRDEYFTYYYNDSLKTRLYISYLSNKIDSSFTLTEYSGDTVRYYDILDKKRLYAQRIYDSDNYLSEHIDFFNNGASKYIITYDNEHRIIEAKSEKYKDGKWIIEIKRINSYQNGLLAKWEIFQYNSQGELSKVNGEEYTYNTGLIETVMRYEIENNEKKYNLKNEYKYTSNGYLKEHQNFRMIDNKWELTDDLQLEIPEDRYFPVNYSHDIYWGNTVKIYYQGEVSVHETTNQSLNFAFPNPFAESTVIQYSVETPSQVKLELYDLAGRMVKHIDNGIEIPGEQSIEINGTDLISGRYFYKLYIGNEVQSGSVVLNK